MFLHFLQWAIRENGGGQMTHTLARGRHQRLVFIVAVIRQACSGRVCHLLHVGGLNEHNRSRVWQRERETYLRGVTGFTGVALTTAAGVVRVIVEHHTLCFIFKGSDGRQVGLGR